VGGSTAGPSVEREAEKHEQPGFPLGAGVTKGITASAKRLFSSCSSLRTSSRLTLLPDRAGPFSALQPQFADKKGVFECRMAVGERVPVCMLQGNAGNATATRIPTDLAASLHFTATWDCEAV
jgi:hypothetical protein